MILFQHKYYFNIIIIVLCIIAPALLVAQPVQVGQDIDGTSNGENSGYRTALNDDATILVTTSPWGTASSNHEGYVKVFHLVGNTWEQLGSTLFGENLNDAFGVDMELSADGSILAIASPQNGDNGYWSGKIRVYQFDGIDWVQMGSDLLGLTVSETFGLSIALSDDGLKMAVGSPNHEALGQSTGVVRTYFYDGIDWVQRGSEFVGDRWLDRLGISLEVSADGDIMAIGSQYNPTSNYGNGEVAVYQWDGADWELMGDHFYGTSQDTNLGDAIALSADGMRLVISDPYNDLNNTINSAGRVRAYDFNGTNWVQKGQSLQGIQSQHRFGTQVVLNNAGDQLAVGSMYYGEFESQAGQVRIYELEGFYWLEKVPFLNGEAQDDVSGWSIEFDAIGDHIIIGAPGNDDGGWDSGHARVFNIENLLATSSFEVTNLKVYPTLVKEQLHVSSDQIIEQIHIYSSYGREVLSISANALQETLSLGHLSAGVYIVKISVSGANTVVKIVKN